MKLHSDQMISRYIFQKIDERLEKLQAYSFSILCSNELLKGDLKSEGIFYLLSYNFLIAQLFIFIWYFYGQLFRVLF